MKYLKVAAFYSVVSAVVAAAPAYAVSYLYEFTAIGFLDSASPPYFGPQNYIVDVVYDPENPGYNYGHPLFNDFDQLTVYGNESSVSGRYLFTTAKGNVELEINAYFNQASGLASGFLYYTYPIAGIGNNTGYASIVSGRRYIIGDTGYSGLGFKFLSSVPEPATWALMIAGFGIVGSTMRRRNRRIVDAVDIVAA